MTSSALFLEVMCVTSVKNMISLRNHILIWLKFFKMTVFYAKPRGFLVFIA